jgi:hypothetical protein
MISPGQWLSEQQGTANKLYNQYVQFRNTPTAEDFLSEPFELKIVHLKNTEGQLETYLVNKQKNEMLPILEVEGTTQVGDVSHRFRGIGEEGRNKLKEVLESAKDGSASAFEKALQLLGN